MPVVVTAERLSFAPEPAAPTENAVLVPVPSAAFTTSAVAAAGIRGVKSTLLAFSAATFAAPTATATAVGRDYLVGGTYVPGATTTGLLPGSTYTDVYGTSTDVNGASYRILPAGTYTRQRYWCQIRWSGNVTFIDCDFCGPDPAAITNQAGHIQNYNTTNFHGTLIDCRISSTPWRTNFPGRPLASGVVRTPSPWGFGIHGGNFTLKRCEITDVQDGINYVQNGWVVGSSTSYCLIEQSWIHRMWHMNDWQGTGTPTNHLTHNDVFQTNNGKNITIRWSMLGGNRVQAGYEPWPGGANTGDDAYSSILQLQQEKNDTEAERVENLLIEENWIWGGIMGVNVSFKTPYPSNNGSTWTIRNNRFYTRPNQSAAGNWSNGANNPSINPTTGLLADPNNNFGAYMTRSTSNVSTITGNRQVDPTTGADLGPVTITAQGNNN